MKDLNSGFEDLITAIMEGRPLVRSVELYEEAEKALSRIPAGDTDYIKSLANDLAKFND